MNFDRLILKLHCFLWSFKRADFYRDLADALSRKVAIRDQLERAASNALMLQDGTSLRVMRALGARLAAGQGTSLAELMRGIAPHSDQMLMQAVDDAGADRAQALELTADAVDFQRRTLVTIASEMVVPLMAIPMVGILSVILAQVIVGISADTPPEVWTGFNGFVRLLAESINEYSILIGAALVASIATLLYQLPRWTGNARLKADKLPIFGLYRDYNAAIVLSALAMMIRSGKTMREALEALRSNARPWLRWHLTRIITSIEDNPNDYLSAFSRGLMPPPVRARLASLLDSAKSFGDALIVLGASEVKSLEKRVNVSAVSANWTLTGFFATIAIVLSIGMMTISTALSDEADPSRMLQRSQQRR